MNMTREQALQAIKAKMDYYESDKRLRAAIETLIPELAESEYERIRKEIVSVIQKHYPNTPESYRWISWLEKQKERGPLTKEEEYTLHRIIEYLEDETCPSEWISLLHNIYCLPYEKQKECHEEPKIAFGDWGDKEKKEAIITCLKYMRFIKKITNQEYDDLMNWLDSNLVSKEWSEEDEVYLQDALWCVKQAAKVAKDENDMGACWSAENWLKSLRPSWKPSEEQMNALQVAAMVSKTDFNTLTSLLVDLKKL